MTGYDAAIIASVVLFSTGHWIGGTVLLSLAVLAAILNSVDP